MIGSTRQRLWKAAITPISAASCTLRPRRRFDFSEKNIDFDECQVDKSGRWLVIKENVDGLFHYDNRVIDLQNGTERLVLDQDGGGGHSDMGFGYMISADNFGADPSTQRLWKFGDDPMTGPIIYRDLPWGQVGGGGPNHIAHGNAKSQAPESQYACGSSANATQAPRSNEVICFKLNGSLDVLVAAPVMTDLAAAGGGDDAYSKHPKGNVDVTGRYFM